MSLKDKIPGYNTLVLPYHFLQSALARSIAGRPDKKLHIIGVTGTNGKTTTSFMIWKMLNEAGLKTGLMTTVAWGVSDEAHLKKQVEHMTTVDPKTLNHRIKAIKNSGAEYLVLEVTSHALAQFRTLGIHFDIAVMTNVTHEHLDYHKTFGNYVAAKCKLFRQADFGIINSDDPSAKKFESAISPHDYITYGIKSGKTKAENVKLTSSGVEYTASGINIKTKIPGEFNVYNSLAAVCVGKRLGLKMSKSKKASLLWKKSKAA